MDFYSLLHVSKGNKHHTGSFINNPKEVKDRDLYLQMAQGENFLFFFISWFVLVTAIFVSILGAQN